uniref:Testican-1 n=1 Tax=Nothoprocta perdicaria TaxID=30464 RepID=A0A8C6ZA06_NOTPE
MLMSAVLVLAAWCFLQAESRRAESLAGAGSRGDFLDNDKWLSTVSQYDRDKYWNKFRDDDYFRNWNPNKPFDQGKYSAYFVVVLSYFVIHALSHFPMH